MHSSLVPSAFVHLAAKGYKFQKSINKNFYKKKRMKWPLFTFLSHHILRLSDSPGWVSIWKNVVKGVCMSKISNSSPESIKLCLSIKRNVSKKKIHSYISPLRPDSMIKDVSMWDVQSSSLESVKLCLPFFKKIYISLEAMIWSSLNLINKFHKMQKIKALHSSFYKSLQSIFRQ